MVCGGGGLSGGGIRSSGRGANTCGEEEETSHVRMELRERFE
jgi:hypothetical protein